jgi:hypothetical protein
LGGAYALDEAGLEEAAEAWLTLGIAIFSYVILKGGGQAKVTVRKDGEEYIWKPEA